jgi:putative phage-type endonuclease
MAFELIDCLNEIIPDDDDDDCKFFSEKDELELYEMCFHLMYEFIQENPTIITDPNFDEIFDENISEIVHLHFIDSIYYTDSTEEEIDEIISICKKDFFETVIPPRSYSSSIILQNPTIDETTIQEITTQIDILRNKPQPIQRTTQWYLERFNLITASNAYKIFESDAMRNQLIYEKCQPSKMTSHLEGVTNTEPEPIAHVNTNSPMHWGQKYEPLSVKIYEARFNTVVEDFGCIKHNSYSFLGASPDGINVDETNNRYGRMLEIKNIVNREIDGIPKKEYWIQMQLQMEVCNLNECDFLETKFIEYENYDEFKQDSTTELDTDDVEFLNLCKSKDNKVKGVIIHFHQKTGYPFYDYMPFDLFDEEDIDEWTQQEIAKYESEHGYIYVNILYWKLEKVSCVLVCRNKEWFNANVKEMENFWKLIEHERIHGFDHRQPNRRNNTTNSNNQSIIVKKLPEINLLLDTNKMKQFQEFKSSSEPKCLLKIIKSI